MHFSDFPPLSSFPLQFPSYFFLASEAAVSALYFHSARTGSGAVMCPDLFVDSCTIYLICLLT